MSTPAPTAHDTAPMTPIEGAALATPLPDTSAKNRIRTLIALEELRGWRRRLINTLLLGLTGWIGFFFADVFVMVAVSPHAILTRMLLRFVPAIAVVAVLVYLRRAEHVSASTLRAIELVCFPGATACVAWLAAVHPDGITSFHICGSVMVVLTYGIMTGRSWRSALLPIVAMTAMVPIVLLAAAFFSPHIAAQWHDTRTVLRFLSAYSTPLGGAALTLVGGEIVSRLRRRLAEAQSIGRYQLRRHIASGGMGEVWAAYHAGLGRDVAVKIIRATTAKESDVLRFEREVRATAELTHPNIVRVFDYGVTEDGHWYYAMELLDGDDLQSLVERDGPFVPSRALRLVTQAAQALGEAHSRGIVHRDVKPANLLVQRSGSSGEYVKLIDFGIARSLGTDNLTHTGMVIGTPGYIAPELVLGQPAGVRADVYGLGAVLYFLLVGRMPFRADDARSLVLAHVHDAVVPPSELTTEPVSAELDAIVLKCLAKSPADRYANGEELARALLACAD